MIGESDVGDIMRVRVLRCWWQNDYVGDFFGYVENFCNVKNPSSKQTVFNVRHQHLKHVTNTNGVQNPSKIRPKSVTNIDVTDGPLRGQFNPNAGIDYRIFTDNLS